jgi:hypothetical protein
MLPFVLSLHHIQIGIFSSDFHYHCYLSHVGCNFLFENNWRERGRKREKAVLELGRTLQKEPILLMGN